MTLEERIKNRIRDIVDYPKPGIVFKDISPVLADHQLMEAIVHEQANHWRSLNIEAIAAIEARGFIFGSLMARALKCPFIPVRKFGKLPYKTVSREYALEYGTAQIEMHIDAIEKGMRVLVHDDLLATGGTAAAAGELVKNLGGELIGFSFLINLSFLPGATKLIDDFGVKPYYLVEY